VRTYLHVLAWDLYNEPDNPNRNSHGDVELPDKAAAMMPLLKKVFAWARHSTARRWTTSAV